MFDDFAKRLGELGGLPEAFVTASENRANRQMVVEDWKLGPEVTSIDPKANKPYWAALAKAWVVDDKVARRRFCANCEYFDNSTQRQAEMEAIPLDALDRDGGGRGFCVKFDFICHNLRVCQAWEEAGGEYD